MNQRKTTSIKTQQAKLLDDISNRFDAAEKSGSLAARVREVVLENRDKARIRSRVTSAQSKLV